MALASTFDTSGAAGALIVTFASASAMASAAGCINLQWNGADTGSSIARLAPLVLAISTARSTAALSPETTTCPPPLSLAAWQTWPCADRHGFLHGKTTGAEQPGRICNRQAAGRSQRRIFAERVARDKGRIPPH